MKFEKDGHKDNCKPIFIHLWEIFVRCTRASLSQIFLDANQYLPYSSEFTEHCVITLYHTDTEKKWRASAAGWGKEEGGKEEEAGRRWEEDPGKTWPAGARAPGETGNHRNCV